MRKLCFAALFCLAALPGRAGEPAFGFRGMEIYKLDRGIFKLTAADVDGDGVRDLLIVNNSTAKIEVFLRRKEPVAPKGTAEKRPNDLVYDRFYERREILTEQQVYSLAAADFDHDGKLDVAYYGKLEQVVVAHGNGKGGFPSVTSTRLEDGLSLVHGLAAGDLNGDGRDDLVVLVKDATAILYQTDKGTLAEPVKLPRSYKKVGGAFVVDLDGDGRNDLVQLATNSLRSLRVNFQQADGSLGAEVSFETAPWRELGLADIDPAPGTEVLVVQRQSGVFRALQQSASKRSRAGLGTVETHAFESTRGKRDRSLALGDLNGDGRTDVVVTEPGVAQVAVYLQDAQGRLAGRRLFPSLANSDAALLADFDGDKRDELVVLSAGERAAGVTRWTENALPFPTLMKLPGVPKAMAAGDVNGDGRTDLLVVSELDEKEGKTKLKAFQFFFQKEAGGLPAEPDETIRKAVSQAPNDLLLADLDGDQRTDLLSFDSYGPARIWRRLPDGKWDDLAERKFDYRSGLVNRIKRGQVNLADVDGDGKAELLVATANYARAMKLDAQQGLEVVDQANGASPRSQIKGVAALDLDGDRKLEIALFDATKKTVTVLARDAAGVFAVQANLEIGELDFRSMHATDLNGDGAQDLLLFGKDRFGVLYAKAAVRELEELHSMESSVRDARLADFVVGDLNGDRKPDVAIFDVANRSMQVLSYDTTKGFTEQIRWSVYEKKLHERRSSRGAAITGMVIDDLDGDGKNDLALLIHDRLIVYPQ